jgi:hypothetical protein
MRVELTEYGREIAIDATGLPAFGSRQRFAKKGCL